MTTARLSDAARTVGVALLPAIVVFGCAGRASAECGSYVTVLEQSGHTRPIHADARHPNPTPCHGPTCHGTPVAPVPVPVPSAPPTHPTEVKGLVVEPGSAGASAFADRLTANSEGCPIRRSTSVFHPPRAG